MDIKTKLKKIRKNMGLTQSQFADKAGFSRSTISEYENGTRKVTLEAIEKLADATNTNASDWIDEDIKVDVKAFDGLKMVINAMYQSNQINDKGETSEENRKLLHQMLDQEIIKYLKIIKK